MTKDFYSISEKLALLRSAAGRILHTCPLTSDKLLSDGEAIAEALSLSKDLLGSLVLPIDAGNAFRRLHLRKGSLIVKNS